MLAISPDKIAHIIIRARQLESGAASERELREFIGGLNTDEKAELTAVMWIGRETFAVEEIDEAIQTAREEATAPTEDYLLGSAMLADHLEDGLAALGMTLEEAEEGVWSSV